MKNLLARILCSAASSMWAKESTLGAYSSETEQHELNLAFHYACELRNWFPWLNCDFDVSKRVRPPLSETSGKKKHKRPDIIFHLRKAHALNFLVVEVKRKRSSPAAKEDLQRVRYNWMEEPYKYRFGASVIMADDKPWFNVRILSREQKEKKPIALSSATMGTPLPPPNFSIDDLKALVEEMAPAKEGNPAALEREIDKQIQALYGQAPEETKIAGHSARIEDTDALP